MKLSIDKKLKIVNYLEDELKYNIEELYNLRKEISTIVSKLKIHFSKEEFDEIYVYGEETCKIICLRIFDKLKYFFGEEFAKTKD